ncbi:MAG: hypothetical protein EOP64_00150 [Sphingomonas sp.]|nr:MAG: hypothetical protein EOP64_00150 [Sphingomonas sp.]
MPLGLSHVAKGVPHRHVSGVTQRLLVCVLFAPSHGALLAQMAPQWQSVAMAKDKGGAPTKYDWRFCDRLTRHLAKGFSFESFGAEVNVHRDTLYEWAKRHRKFSDAKKVGEAYREDFLLRMGQGIALGTHRYLKSETPMLDSMNRPVLGADGKPLMVRKYAPSKCNAAVWIFMMKNMAKWTDRQDMTLSGVVGGAPIAVGRADQETHEERIAELERLQAQRELCDED